MVEIIVTIFVILVLINIYITKNNNSIFNISACLINNQSKLYLVYNVFNLSNHTILLTFEGSIIDNYFFTPNYQMEQFGPNFFVCPQVGVEPTSQTYFVWFYHWATEGYFLFGSLDDISITHSFVKVNRLMIFFSLARRVGFEPTDGFRLRFSGPVPSAARPSPHITGAIGRIRTFARLSPPSSLANCPLQPLEYYRIMAGHIGLEPIALRLTAECSTIELMSHF